ncbi:hypothetical protein ON010_g4948 [Phytophthora cinnamomi]|nr:hypothetical protein ON010_g4948 [Phytophthora cinnamomi]
MGGLPVGRYLNVIRARSTIPTLKSKQAIAGLAFEPAPHYTRLRGVHHNPQVPEVFENCFESRIQKAETAAEIFSPTCSGNNGCRCDTTRAAQMQQPKRIWEHNEL